MSQLQEIIVGRQYRHFKGTIYEVDAIAEHTETHEKLVMYHSVNAHKKIWARPYNMFASKVDKLKYPDVEAEWRFTPVVAGE
ncbi:MAG: DUF1653 domain-containing protein [Muribaculaceae bacterium]|nr:DUF1653 domain-containing protein [Muribaculaceae bacterium]